MIRSRKRVKELGEVFTPEYIVEKMLDLFPEEVWYDSKFNFLEPSAGTGVFIKSILKRRMKFLSEEICRKTIYAVEIDEINCEELKQFEINLTKGNFLEEYHKFKNISNLIVVGNPPYQMQTEAQKNRSSEDAQSKPLYHLFVEAIIDGINPNHFSMIIPSRWMVGGKGLDSFRYRMINDNHMKTIVDDMSCNGVFDSVDISGGVNYFLWSKNHNGPCDFNGVERFLNEEDIVIRENSARSILTKIKNKAGRYIGTIVSPRKPYGIDADSSFVDSGIPCWFKQSVGKKFVDQQIVKFSRDDISMYKVLTPYALIAGQTDFTKPISFYTQNNIVIASPGEICSETYIVVNSFDTEAEANNFVKYMKTKLFRFMLRMRVISQHVTRECYNWVPDMEDYTKEYTDKCLYKKFGLNEEEIAYIESKIKTLEPKKS